MSTIEDDSSTSNHSSVSQGGGYSYLPLHQAKVSASDRPVVCSRKIRIFYAIFMIVSAALLAILCALIALRLIQSGHFVAIATIDAGGLPACNSSQSNDGFPRELPCAKWQNGSLAILLGLGQSVAPLRLRGADASASGVGVVDSSVIYLMSDAGGLKIARAGMYQIDAQVTFLETHLYDNADAHVSVNGRRFAQCHRFLGAAAMPCPISVVRRFAAGDRVTLGADPLLAVAADPTMTFLSVATLHGVRGDAVNEGSRVQERK